MHNKKFLATLAFLTASSLAIINPVSAQTYDPILRNFDDGPAGFGELALPRNDDGSSGRINLPFEVNFFGNMYDSFFINNNGNLTFNGGLSNFTPEPFPLIGRPLIGPYFADVDTRCADCGEVYLGSTLLDGKESVVVTWNEVGYFSDNADKLNTFQAVLIDQSAGNAPGDFDIQFRYNPLEWTTGDASGGSGGLGGTPAQAGFDAGNGLDFFALPGSFTSAVLDLQNTSNVSANTPGLWSFAIRSGETPGGTPENPLLPEVPQNPEDGFNFEFNVEPGEIIFIDPIVAVGYDYIVNSGPNIASVIIPNDFTVDGSYDLSFGGLSFELLPNVEFDFTSEVAGGVSSFTIEGIDAGLGLDPLDPLAFVTGLSFVDGGLVQLSQIPILFDTDGGGGTDPTTPEPSLLLGLLAVGGFGAMSRRSRQK